MKLREHFVGDLLQAVRASQGKDPAAATAIIQDALRTAGLMPGAPAPQRSPGRAPDRAPEPALDRDASFVDLNPAPTWAGRPAASRSAADTVSDATPDAASEAAHPTGHAMPDLGAGLRDAFAGWAGKFGLHQPGQPGARAPHADPAAPGQFLEGETANPAGARRYRLYVPARPAEGPRPLVVMLHGCKQDAADFAAGTAMNALAEQHGCLVLYPEQTARANGSNCWNWFEAQHQEQGAGEPSIIADMTREVIREHGADAARVYVAGLSAGGAMAAIMAASYPGLYAAVGVHSGLAAGSAHDLMSGLHAMKGGHGRTARHAAVRRPVPVIVFHGDQDGVVNPSNGDAVLRQFMAEEGLRIVEEAGEDGRRYTKTAALDEAGRTRAEHWVLHGLGHAWAGGSPAGSYTDAAGPGASAEMLRFFLQHRQP